MYLCQVSRHFLSAVWDILQLHELGNLTSSPDQSMGTVAQASMKYVAASIVQRTFLWTVTSTGCTVTCYQHSRVSICPADLIRYMDKSSSNSGGSSVGSHTAGGGIVGSTTAPVAYGVQFMPQPQETPQHAPPMSQGSKLSAT